MTETRRSYCGLCHPRCGLRLEIQNGRAVKVSGDPEHLITRGRICSRGKLMLDHVYHPDRLDYPLKRKGERGSGRWERITWLTPEQVARSARLYAMTKPAVITWGFGLDKL
jgi:thiosulfate reductase/polysulfide reductase chain A